MKYVCSVCGFVYDEAIGMKDAGIAPGTKWADLPENFRCPLCGAVKSDFAMQEPSKKDKAVNFEPKVSAKKSIISEDMRQLSNGELAAICSNLAKASEKQYLPEQAALFEALSAYYAGKTEKADTAGFDAIAGMVRDDLNRYSEAGKVAAEASDRGARRALVWSEKVTKILSSLLARYEKEGDALLEGTNVWVCEVCGFVYIGDEPPEVCPVCKVPRFKISRVRR